MKIGIVLSGGMAKGAYQVGALRAVSEFLPRSEIECLSCASVGVLNGYAFATDNLDGAENMWLNICGDQEKMVIGQVLRSEGLKNVISGLYNHSTDFSFSLYTTLFDFSNRNVVYRDLSKVEHCDIEKYLSASVSLPVYNQSVQIGNTQYFDGAMIDNIPVFPLTETDYDYIICIYFDERCYKFENADFDSKVIKITFPAESMLRQSLVFRRDKIEKMLKDGYDITKSSLSPFFEKGYDNLDYIYEKIEEQNRSEVSAGLRLTGDVIVTNLNKITQRLTRKKLI